MSRRTQKFSNSSVSSTSTCCILTTSESSLLHSLIVVLRSALALHVVKAGYSQITCELKIYHMQTMHTVCTALHACTSTTGLDNAAGWYKVELVISRIMTSRTVITISQREFLVRKFEEWMQLWTEHSDSTSEIDLSTLVSGWCIHAVSKIESGRAL